MTDRFKRIGPIRNPRSILLTMFFEMLSRKDTSFAEDFQRPFVLSAFLIDGPAYILSKSLEGVHRVVFRKSAIRGLVGVSRQLDGGRSIETNPMGMWVSLPCDLSVPGEQNYDRSESPVAKSSSFVRVVTRIYC